MQARLDSRMCEAFRERKNAVRKPGHLVVVDGSQDRCEVPQRKSAQVGVVSFTKGVAQT